MHKIKYLLLINTVIMALAFMFMTPMVTAAPTTDAGPGGSGTGGGGGGTGGGGGSSGGGDSEEDTSSDDSFQIADGCSAIKTSLIHCPTTVKNPSITLLAQIINFLAIGVGIAVVGGIIWGGMLYASSNGDPSKTKQGVSVIVNAIIGLLLFIFMYAIINYLVPGGLISWLDHEVKINHDIAITP